MKKVLFMLMAAVCMLTMNACQGQGANKGGATVEVAVKKAGAPLAAETVYQFSSTKYNQPSFIQPIHADKQAVTDENGVATFELRETFDLDIIDEQTTLYYVVFAEDKKTIAGKTAVTIKKGETKQATISL